VKNKKAETQAEEKGERWRMFLDVGKRGKNRGSR
jgi:hypothetical protein